MKWKKGEIWSYERWEEKRREEGEEKGRRESRNGE